MNFLLVTNLWYSVILVIMLFTPDIEHVPDNNLCLAASLLKNSRIVPVQSGTNERCPSLMAMLSMMFSVP